MNEEENLPTGWVPATNFGFSIPAGASIDGIVVEILDMDDEPAD